MFYKLETQEKYNTAVDELDYNVICMQFERSLKKIYIYAIKLQNLKSSTII